MKQHTIKHLLSEKYLKEILPKEAYTRQILLSVKNKMYNLKAPIGQLNFYVNKETGKNTIAQASASEKYPDPKFSGEIILDKVIDAEAIKAFQNVMEAILIEECILEEGQTIKDFKERSPFVDGDAIFEEAQKKINKAVKAGEEETPNRKANYRNKMVLKFSKKPFAKKTGKAQIIDVQKTVKQVTTDIDPNSLVAGDYFICTGTMMYYDMSSTNKGLTFIADKLGLYKHTDEPLYSSKRVAWSDEDEYVEPETASEDQMTYDEDNSFNEPR